MAFDVLILAAALQAASAPPPESDEGEIIVTAPKSEAERRKELRDMAEQVIRPPRRDRPVARFFYPICVKVLGLQPEQAAAIEARMRANAEQLGVGANDDPDCVPTVKVAFVSPRGGAPETWLDMQSPAIAHLPIYQRERVLAEEGPVRAWNKTKLRGAYGQPLDLFEGVTRADYQPGKLPVTNEITGAAVMIALDAAMGKTTDQVADYATMRSLLGTAAMRSNETAPAASILSLFNAPDAPQALTAFDRALVSGAYAVGKNDKQRRTFNTIAKRALETLPNTPTGEN